MFIDKIVEKINILNKLKESAKTDFVFSLSGANIGEKILSIYSIKMPLV